MENAGTRLAAIDGDAARVLLAGPVRIDSHLYQAITRRQDLTGNRGVLEAAALLYLDRESNSVKRGCQPSRAHPGTVQRFVRVLQQRDLTYDVYGMSGREILETLPSEFTPRDRRRCSASPGSGGTTIHIGAGCASEDPRRVSPA